MKNKLIRLVGLGALASTLMFAQTTTEPSAPAGHKGWRHGHSGQRVAKYLGLTADQQAQAKQIRADARQQSAALRDQMKQNREALREAIKAGNDAQIDQITKSQAPVMAQLASIRAHSAAKFYAILTPDQKTKFDNMRQMMNSRHAGPRAKVQG